MEEANENLSIAKLFDIKKKKKKTTKKKTKANKDGGGGFASSSSSSGATSRISLFDSSAENFFRDMDTIARLCREEERHATLEQSDIQRMSSSVTFLRYVMIINNQLFDALFVFALFALNL